MKKLILMAVLGAFVLPGGAFAQGLKVGTIDMNRAFKEYNKTKDAEKKINDAKDAAKKEYDDRADSYKKALDEINKLNQQLEAPALSADSKTQKAKERDEKIASIKNMEREINDFRQTREKQLQEQAVRMRDGIVKEISDVVMTKVKASNMDLVFDTSGVSSEWGAGRHVCETGDGFYD
jgi:outer membrane protein